MKKFILSIALAACAASTFAQGTITFQNNGAIFVDSTIDRKVYVGQVGGAGLTGTNWAAQLWYDTGNGLRSLDTSTRLFRPATTSLPGTWNTAPTATLTFPDLAINGTAQLQVRVWDIQKFATFAAASASGRDFGSSELFAYTVPASGSAASASTLNGLRAFSVVVPEPSTIALGVLGLGSLLLFRRKKA